MGGGTKTSNNSSGGGGAGGNKSGGKGKGKESKKDEGKEGKLKPATAINSRHILVSPLLLLERRAAFFPSLECVCACVRGLNENPRGGN